MEILFLDLASFLSGFRIGEGFPKRLYDFYGFPWIGEVEDIRFTCTGVRGAALGICHKRGNAGEFFYISEVVARRNDTLPVYVYNILTHHFAAAYLSEGAEGVADKVNEFSGARHGGKGGLCGF